VCCNTDLNWLSAGAHGASWIRIKVLMLPLNPALVCYFSTSVVSVMNRQSKMTEPCAFCNLPSYSFQTCFHCERRGCTCCVAVPESCPKIGPWCGTCQLHAGRAAAAAGVAFVAHRSATLPPAPIRTTMSGKSPQECKDELEVITASFRDLAVTVMCSDTAVLAAHAAEAMGVLCDGATHVEHRLDVVSHLRGFYECGACGRDYGAVFNRKNQCACCLTYICGGCVKEWKTPVLGTRIRASLDVCPECRATRRAVTAAARRAERKAVQRRQQQMRRQCCDSTSTSPRRATACSPLSPTKSHS
jgi:hypothetical protein